MVDPPSEMGYPSRMAGQPKKRAREANIKRAVELGLLDPGARVIPPPTMALLPPEETALSVRDLASLEKIAMTASPEEFARASAIYFRRLLVMGLANVPVPKTIKEIQAIADMIRKSEGMDGKGSGIGGGLVGPRMVVRGALGRVVDVAGGDDSAGRGGNEGVGNEGVGNEGVGNEGAGNEGVAVEPSVGDAKIPENEIDALNMTQKGCEVSDKQEIMDERQESVADFEV